MSFQSNSKATHNDRDEKNALDAFSRFVRMIYKDESENSENTNEFHDSANAQSTSGRFPSNVLTKNHTLENSKNIANAHSPPRQYKKLPHHVMRNNDPCSSSSLTQSNNMMPPRLQNRGEIENSYQRNSTIFSISEGVIHVSLRHGVRIDITVDNAIYLTSCAGQIVVSLSNKGDASAVKHPNGLMQQIDRNVQIIAHGQSKAYNYARFANMSTNGITFTSSMLGEVFVLDSIGTRQTKKPFVKLTGDKTSAVFLAKSKLGSTYNEEAKQLIKKGSIKKCAEEGMDVITINDYRIWQMKDGLVTVARMSFPFKIRSSPMNCSFTLSTPHIHCTASSKEAAHLFARCQDQSMHYDGKNFVVRYNGNSAGFDENDFLNVY